MVFHLTGFRDEMSDENCVKVNYVAAPLPDEDIQVSLESKNPDTFKATVMSRPSCPTRSFETQQYGRQERRSGGEGEVVKERMYVGGLNPEVTGELLAEVFCKFGLVKNWFIVGFTRLSTLLNHMLLR